MEKNIFLLFTSLLLTGCVAGNFQNSSQKAINNEEKEQDNDNKPSQEGGQQQEGSGGQTGGQSSQQEEIKNLQEYTCEVMTSTFKETSNDYAIFAGKFPAGYDFNSVSHNEELKNFLDDQLEYYDLITSIETTNMHTQKFDSNTYLQLGSGSDSVGVFKWVSSVKIYKVEAKVLCYTKYDSYHSLYNTDSWAHFAIDSTDNDMTGKVDENNKPLINTYSKAYDDGVNSFSLSSSFGRVYIRSLSITWRG